MSKKRDDGPGGRCTHPGCRRKATTWNNIGPETGEGVCASHAHDKPRKPRPFKNQYRVTKTFTGGTQLERWVADVSWMVVTNNPGYMRALAEFLNQAADWMESQRE